VRVDLSFRHLSPASFPIASIFTAADSGPRHGDRIRIMQSQNRIFDDLAKVAGGALGALSNLKQEMEAMVRDRVERFMADNNMVPREEFEAVKAMAAEARAEQERLAARVAALEAALNAKSGAASSS